MDLGGQQLHQHHEASAAATDLGPYETKLNKLLLGSSGMVVAHGGNNGIAAEDAAPTPPAGAHAQHKAGGGKNSKVVRFRECLKNHAASIGGHAVDGCGEFMPSGEEGTMEALKCAACDCHRNFHRREVEGEPLICDICHMNRRDRNRRAAAIAAGVLASSSSQQQSPGSGATTTTTTTTPNTTPASARAMSLLGLGGRGDEGAGGDGEHGQQQQLHHHLMSPLSMKKRFRTKFSMDQKERMYMFAEKVGWRIQKHDEAAVQQFCAEVGVKRHVLKVWMHNNKHTFGKRPMVAMLPSPSPPPQQTPLAAAAAAAAAAVAAAASGTPHSSAMS